MGGSHVGNYVISAYSVWRILAHRFAILVPSLVWDLGLFLGTTLTS